MELNFKLDPPSEDLAAKKRARAAHTKRQKALAEPTWEQVWDKGYETGTGYKKGIYQTVQKGSLDWRRLQEVRAAIDAGELGLENPSLRKFTKTQALRLWKALQQQNKDKVLADLVKNTPNNYKLIQTEQALDDLVLDLSQETIIAVDTETTGVDVFTDKLVGISITLPIHDYHVYIPVAHKTPGTQLKRLHVLKKLKPILCSPYIRKVLHNAKFDMHILIRHGIRMTGVVHDTMLAMQVLNENEESFALKKLATKYKKYLGYEEESKTFEDLFGRNAQFAEVPLDVALVYAAKDTELTWRLYQWQVTHLKQTGFLDRLYRELENPLIDVCVMMEQTGFLIDGNFAKQYGMQLQQEIAHTEADLIEHFGDNVNFNSPSQLQEIFYNRLALPDVSRSRSTDVKTLKKLKDKHAGVEALLKYRKLSKLYGTYVEALPAQVKADGRVHGSFNQLATVTGRFASRDPNLQNIPPEARKLIIAPEGMVILGIDYSQIEPRVLAHMSGDHHFQEPYLKGRDLYSTLASRVFNQPLEECGDSSVWRKKMKVGLLAVMYGTSMFTLAEQLGISVEEAHQFINDFYTNYPDVYAFIKETHGFVKEHEYVLTLNHRKRRFRGHRPLAIRYDQLAIKICEILKTKDVPHDYRNRSELPFKLKKQFSMVRGEVERVRRMAVNARIQGSAADIMKRGLINLYKYCCDKGYKLIGTVHDEALLIVPETITSQAISEIESCMVEAAALEVPVKVDTEIMRRWGDGYTKKEWFKSAA